MEFVHLSEHVFEVRVRDLKVGWGLGILQRSGLGMFVLKPWGSETCRDPDVQHKSTTQMSSHTGTWGVKVGVMRLSLRSAFGFLHPVPPWRS